MPGQVSNIIISPAKVYNAPLGTPLVADSSIAGADWGGDWTSVGLTATSVSALYEFEEIEAEVEQTLGPAKRKKTSENFTVETTLAEFYLDGVQLAMGGTVVETVAGPGQPSTESLEVGGESYLAEKMWGFEGMYEQGENVFPVRFYIWRATSKINGALEFGKKTQTGLPLQVKALTKDDKGKLFKIVRITGEAG